MGRKNDGGGYSRQFEEFWTAYPFRRGSKWNAFECFQKCIKRSVEAIEIIDGARRFASVVQLEERDPRYVPHATTWLNGRRWETIDDDEAAAIASAESSGRSKPTNVELTERAVAYWLRSFDGGTECGTQSRLQFVGDPTMGLRTE